ncbi:MAG: PRC-barrel domain-containing protein [Rhodospirillaceae bacterium]
MRISLMTTLMASALALGTAANAQQTPAEQPPQQAEGAEIQVQQPPPQITVEQPAPQVTVEQPDPQVSVQQGEPNVQVEQAEPNVEVTTQGEPEVKVQEQAQQPQEPASEPPPGAQGTDEQQQRAQEAQTGASTEQADTTTATGGQVAGLQEIMDKDVYGAGDEQVGTVTDVLVDNQGQPKMVIVEHGGFLGIGSREVGFEIDQVQVAGDRVQVPATKDQIAEMPEWDESQVATSGYTSQRVTTQPAEGQPPSATTTTPPASTTTRSD